MNKLNEIESRIELTKQKNGILSAVVSSTSAVALVVIVFLLGMLLLAAIQENNAVAPHHKANEEFQREVKTMLQDIKSRTDDRIYRKEIKELLRVNPQLKIPQSLKK